jgi:tRNA A37 methylthiotransferase MiaB
VLRGRTRTNKAVNFHGSAAAGELVDVEITASTSQTLAGRMPAPIPV